MYLKSDGVSRHETFPGVILIFTPSTTHGKTSFTELTGRSFTNGLSGSKSLRDFREMGPGYRVYHANHMKKSDSMQSLREKKINHYAEIVSFLVLQKPVNVLRSSTVKFRRKTAGRNTTLLEAIKNILSSPTNVLKLRTIPTTCNKHNTSHQCSPI